MENKDIKNILKKIEKSPDLVDKLNFEQLVEINDFLVKRVLKLRRKKNGE